MYNGPQDLSRTIECNKNKDIGLKKSQTLIQSIKHIKFNNFVTFLNISQNTKNAIQGEAKAQEPKRKERERTIHTKKHLWRWQH